MAEVPPKKIPPGKGNPQGKPGGKPVPQKPSQAKPGVPAGRQIPKGVKPPQQPTQLPRETVEEPRVDVDKVKRLKKIINIEAAVASIILLITIGIFFSDVKDFKLKYNLRRGLKNYSVGLQDDALADLSRAHKSRPKYPYPQLILAKVNVDKGSRPNLEEAKKYYENLLLKNLLKSDEEKHAVYIGLGVISLKMYDDPQEKDKKARLEEAGNYFKEAKKLINNSFEVYVNEAHINLRRYVSTKENKYLEKARRILLTEMEGNVTTPYLDSLVDYHVGRAYIFSQEGNFAAARKEFDKAFTLTPQWEVPFLNRAYALALKFLDPDQYKESDLKDANLQNLNRYLEELVFRGNRKEGDMRYVYARFTLQFALSEAFYERRFKDSGDVFARMALTTIGENDYRPKLLMVNKYLKYADDPEIKSADRKSYIGQIKPYIDEIINFLKDKKEYENLYAIMWNTYVFADFETNNVLETGSLDSQKREVQQLDDKLAIALKYAKEDPDDWTWIIHRNRGVIWDYVEEWQQALLHYRKSYSLYPKQDDVKERIDQLMGGD